MSDITAVSMWATDNCIVAFKNDLTLNLNKTSIATKKKH